MDYNLNGLLTYWKTVFSSTDPVGHLKASENWSQVPPSVHAKFDDNFLPEPFYGYFHETDNLQDDVLLLLINPGEVPDDDLTARYPADSISASRALWNKDTISRHLSWTSQDFYDKEPIKWREERRKGIERILDQNVRFLHTIEFFPFHSRDWTVDVQSQQKWIYELKSTKLSLGAIRDLAKEKQLKAIVGLNKVWKDILEADNGILQPEQVTEVEIWRPSKSKWSFQISLYEFADGSLPILITRLGGGHIKLPSDPAAIQVIQALLRHEPLPEAIGSDQLRVRTRQLR